MKVGGIYIIILLAHLTTCQPYRIFAIFPIRGKSHFSVLEQVVKSLAEKGHQVDVVSGFPLKDPFPNYTDIIKLSFPESRVHQLRYEDFSSRENLMRGMHKDIKRICDFLGNPELMKLIKNPPTGRPYDLVLTQFIAGYQCFTAIGHLWNVPVVGVVTTFLYPQMNDFIGNPLNLATISKNLKVYKENMRFWDRLYNVMMTHYAIYEYYSYANQQEALIKKYFGPYFPHYSELEKSVALIMINSHFSIYGIEPQTPALVEIGGIHIAEDNCTIDKKLQNILDNSEGGFIYLSFGSVTKIQSLPKEVLEKFWAGFSKISTVRVILKVSDPASIQNDIPDNVFAFTWLPQKKVLQHRNIRGFISHGGALGTQEAIYYGVPTICIPFYLDQPIYCDISANKRFGQKLNIFTAEQKDFDKALNNMLHNSSYRDAAKSLSTRYKDRPMKPKEEAVYWVEYVIRNGKNSLKSPAADLAWWQIELLDVYGFVLVCFISILFFSIVVAYRIVKSALSVVRNLSHKSVRKYSTKKLD